MRTPEPGVDEFRLRPRSTGCTQTARSAGEGEQGAHAMGKIVSNFFISLDGVVEAPNKWHFPYFNDEMGATISRGMETSGAWLMGRRLYDEWSSYWPAQSDDVPFASFINNIPKYVVSNSLTDATWNNTTVVSGDV